MSTTSSSVDDPSQRQAAKAAAMHARKNLIYSIVVRLISLVCVLTVWQIGGARISPALFTTPWAIAKAAVDMIGSGELWTYLWPSLVVLFYGLSLGAIVGIAIGLLLARFRLFEAAFDMYITFLYSTPSVALIPIIVLWTGFETEAKVLILFLFTFFPMVINTHQGVQNVDEKLIEVGRAFRCSEWQMWRNIILPAALPFIVTGVRLAIGRALIGVVIADLYTAISGIGYLIVKTASIYEIDRMFVPIVTLGVLGVTLTALLRVVERKIAPWAFGGERG